MRIAHVNDVAFVATEMTAALRALGHEVDLLHPRLYGAKLPPLVKLLIAPARFADWLRLIWRLRRGRYDVVHIHYAYLGLVGILAGVPYVLHCHGDDVRDLARRPWRRLIRLALRRAEHVYYATPDLGPWALAVRPDAEFLPNPMDIETFQPAPPPADAGDVFVICALGHHKGATRILAAVRELSERRPGLRFTVIAGGELTREFTALPTVVPLPHQPRGRLPALMARHRVLIGQVHEGAIGMVELEGMACGRPVVASFRFADFYGGDAPPLVHVDTPAAIVEAVERLLDDPATAAAVGTASRRWVEAHHDAIRIAERLVALYRARIDRPRERASVKA
jgi:glycosyltransferase involved in cell wall biosynthesis